MTEPVYEFIKGRGWVPTEMETITVLSRNKRKRLRIEKRKPKDGEGFIINAANWCIERAAAHAQDFDWDKYWRWDHTCNYNNVFAVVVEDV